MSILALIEEAQAEGAGFEKCCETLDLHPRTVQRWKVDDGGSDLRNGPKTEPKNKLSPGEKKRVIQVVTSPTYRDLSPKQIVPDLADRGVYLASEATIYRLLREENLAVHRGKAKPPVFAPPMELVATDPNQVWSWDITYLRSLIAGRFYYLYLFVDVWSRKIVGFSVEEEESAESAAELLEEIYEREGIKPGEVSVRQDNGGPMKGATLLATMERLGVFPSFSRPRVSDDNPFVESLFRTMKYRPDFPNRPFASIQDAIAWVAAFVAWYNNHHLHSGIGFVTPADRHAGSDEPLLANRRRVYEAARKKNPERWSREIRKWDAPKTVVLSPTPESKQLRVANRQAA